MDHPTASSMAEAASEEEGENDGPIETIASYLKDVEGCMKAVETMPSRKLNNEQCDYLIDKLSLVFQSASSYLEVSRGRCHSSLSFADIERYRGSRSHIDSGRRVEVFKLLLALAEHIESFVRGCCDDAWIKGAMTLANVREYVSSLGFNLELCRAACSEHRDAASLTLDDVHGIFEAEFKIVKQKALVDVATLRAKVLEQHTLSGDNGKLITCLRRRILMDQPTSTIPTAPSTPITPTPSMWSRNSLPGKIGTCCMMGKSRGSSLEGDTEDELLLGRGGSAEVVMKQWLGMSVAKKTFQGGVHPGFTKEVQILKKLCHPNVTSLFFSEADARRCSISMELMDFNLHKLTEKLQIKDRKPYPFSFLEAVDLMLQVGEGVKYLHDQRIVHMDLKSLNVLVRSIKGKDSKTRYYQVKVTDFGLSETKANSNSFSEQAFNVGSNRWMPPERIKFNVGGQETSSKEETGLERKFPKKSDVYSFALVCYEILTGNLPFYEVDERSAKRKAKEGERPILPEQCPLKLKLLIESCWSDDPKERPSFDSICKELKYLKYLLMTDIVVFDTSNYNNGLFTYGGDFLVDRPIARSLEDPYKSMMDRVRHRLEPFTAISSTTVSSTDSVDGGFDFFGNIDSNDGDPSDNSAMTYDPSQDFSQLEILVELLIRSDVFVQIALFQILLEERFAIPIVVPYNEDFNDFRHLLEALNFVQVKIGNEEILSIAENTSLPFVVFVSNRQTVSLRESAHMACEVMNCQFPSKDISKDIGGGPTILELGVGFLNSSTDKQVLRTQCLVFCVSGNHNKLGMILEKIADVAIIEIDPGTKPTFPSWVGGIEGKIDTLFWSIDSRGTGYRNSPSHLWGKFKDISKLITQYMLKTKKFQAKDNDGTSSLAVCFHSLNPLHRPTPVCNIEKLEAIAFDTVRDSLTLQKLYTEEAKFYFLSLQERWRSAELQTEMQRCQKDRKQGSDIILKLPILELFVQLLSEKELTKRCVRILHFQLFIDQKLKTKLDLASKKVIDAFEKTQDDRKNVALKKNYEDAMNDHVNQMLGLEHLWRELSHIFVADPKNRRILPNLAARHLLDGFPLEILDGDATNFYKEWVDTVLIELNAHLNALLRHEPKVFVLSVVGAQSSGKSTLLNIMFGTKLKTSAGVCTRGVFLQLVKSEWPGFDYVLILDTMGLRAPDFYGRDDVQGHDNRLATFAVLPADACIVMVANEDDNGLKDVLPMVMLAFKGSKVAELGGGKIQSKLFFVYRGVDVNDKTKLGKNQRKLQEDLASASSAIDNFEISQTSNQGDNAGSDGVSPLSTFRVNRDEKCSDVKFFGNLKRGTRPPEDTPDWEYGSKVEELRQYIDQRVLDAGLWNAHGLLEWKDYLEMVWLSIAEANFELSFLNHIEHANYHILQTQIKASHLKVGRESQKEFELVAKDLLTGGNIDQSDFGRHSERLKAHVERTIKDENTKVLDLLGQRQFQKWRIAETNRWETDRKGTVKQWVDKLRDFTDGTVRFDNIVRGYITKIQLEISDVGRSHWTDILSPERKTIMEQDFEELFGRILDDAKLKHPPPAVKVEDMIHKLYTRDGVIGKRFGFDDNVENKNIFQKIVWRTSNTIIESWKTFFGLNGAEIKLQELISRVQSALQDVKQYSDHVVVEIMQLTCEYASDAKREVEEDMHKLVKQMLVEKLTIIQDEWDSHHNVARRLEAHRDYLWQSFLNHANKVDGTKMLSMALCKLLGVDQLLDGFKASIAKSVSNSLQSREEWVCNWKVMRAHLDLHLIELIKSEQTQEILKLVSDGAGHYRMVVERLIRKEINDHLEPEWTRFTGCICDAMEQAATEARHSKSDGSKRPVIFQQSIIRSLNNLSEVLARGVSVTLSTEVCSKYSDDIDFKQIHKDVSARVNEVQLDGNKFPIDEVIEMVRNRLIESNTTNARARCDVMCPRCKVTCYKPMDHPGQHNTLHQPQGLCGIYDSDSMTLTHGSCSKSVELEHDLCVKVDDEVPVPYKEWTTIYPDWVLPSAEMGSVEVREYIFAHFQKQLVQIYSRVKACPNIPMEFSEHSLETLQLNLENVVRSSQHHT